MAVNLSALSNVTTTATALSNLILVTPNSDPYYQPQTRPVLEGRTNKDPQPTPILFHYEGENTVTLQSDITDHYVEDNTSVQDQISLRPETVTTQGYIGELNDIVPPILAPLKFLADKLTTIGSYTPALSTTALLAYNNAKLIYDTARLALTSAVATWNTITNSPQAQTKQQQAFSQFYGYWKTQTLFTVQTPWAIFDNMAIQTLRAIQNPETKEISDFEVTFKKMRFAQTIITGGQALQFQARAIYQNQSLLNAGSSSPPPSLGLSEKLTSAFPGSFGGG